MRGEGQRAKAGIGADIRGRLVATNMLFARRERQHEPAITVGVNGLAAQAPRHLAHQFLGTGEQADIGPTEIESVPDGLALAHGNVCTHLTRRCDEAQRDRFGENRDEQRAFFMRGVGRFRKVRHRAENVRALADDAGGLIVYRIGQRILAIHSCGQLDHFEPLRLAHHFGGGGIVRVQPAGQDHFLPARHARRHDGGLGAGRGAVIHGGVCHIHGGHRRNLGLEFEQGLQRALRDFWLVGRIGRQEFRALDHHVYRSRNMMLVGARPDKERTGRGRPVLGREIRHVALDGELPLMVRQAFNRAAEARSFRYVREEFIDCFGADGRQHFCTVFRGQGEVSHMCYSINAYRPSQNAL